jgi:hypothetical protein
MYEAENSLLMSHFLNKPKSTTLGTGMGTETLKIGFFDDKGCGLVVQSGKTSPSRGEDHWFKSGPAHHHQLLSC